MAGGNLYIVCYKWRGWRPVTEAAPVNALCRMVAQYLTIPHRFLCITDDPTGIECPTYPMWDIPKVEHTPTPHNSYRRLRIFSDWAAQTFPGWVLSMDLDVVLLDNINDLITWDDLRVLKGGVSRYRGGLVLHKTGTRQHIWDSFNPVTSPWKIREFTTNGKPWTGSDQGWISVCCPYEKTYSSADGVYVWNSRLKAAGAIPQGARIVFPTGAVKPWHPQFAEDNPVLYDAYRKWL